MIEYAALCLSKDQEFYNNNNKNKQTHMTTLNYALLNSLN